jgi:hypothetical protein
MSKILNLFIKNSLLILVGLFFVSSFILDPFFHEASGEDHSNLECHFCLNEISDETLLDLETNISFLSNFSNIENLDNFTPFLYKNFFSRAPPKI